MAVRFRRSQPLALLVVTSLCAGGALALPKFKTDGQWRAAIGLAASYSSGNTESSSFSLRADAVRATAADKIMAHARALHSKTDGTTNAELLGLGSRYDFNLSARTYAFGQGDYLRDKPANLEMRLSAAGGLGYKLIDTEAHSFEVFGGLGYTRDRYFNRTRVAGSLRSSYGHAEVLIGEQSNHRLTETTTLKQKLVAYPNLDETGEYRAEFDTSIAVAINRTMNLTAGVNYRYNSDPGGGLKKSDVLFLTGVTVKFD